MSPSPPPAPRPPRSVSGTAVIAGLLLAALVAARLSGCGGVC